MNQVIRAKVLAGALDLRIDFVQRIAKILPSLVQFCLTFRNLLFRCHNFRRRVSLSGLRCYSAGYCNLQ